MSIFKCKMCGGTIEFNPGETVGVCDSCGTKQTLPRLDDDRRANLYDRANHFRRNNEFDKAVSLYEQILNEDSTDSEAYWSLVLCRYGIEYVEDPATHKRVPTVNRTQFTSIFDDEDYKSALQHADGYQRTIYEEEANTINEIQKGILAISQNEKPYDVFICYKETDANGRRTQDSVLANDLYHQLKNEGFNVFFSRITLEDKLGTAYEPYIFAALNSANVMVVLGTKPEFFNAVWVKNEWSRYLSLVKQSGGKKVLIPAYRDMDPYDLPEEFSHLQAQDMSKLGFMQDLIRGIKKITDADESRMQVKETVVIEGGANVAPLLKRAYMFLEDGNWSEADIYCEKVLDQDPENADAYLGKLMAELQVRHQDELQNCQQPFNNSNNYMKAMRFGNDNIKEILASYIDYINERNENTRISAIYNNAVAAMNSANTESEYKEIAASFNLIPGFNDSDSLSKQCLEKAEVCRKDSVYAYAKSQMAANSICGYEMAIKSFSTISGWKDTDEQIYTCQKMIEDIKAKEESERLEQERLAEEKRNKKEKTVRKIKRIFVITTLIIVISSVSIVVIKNVIIPNNKYNKAVSLYKAGKYDDAIEEFKQLNGYKDSEKQIENCVTAINEPKYRSAVDLYNAGEYEEAYKEFSALDYKDSVEKADDCLFLKQKEGLKDITVGSIIKFGYYEQDNDISNGKEEIEWKVLDIEENKALVISQYALDYQEYGTTLWDSCSMRTWLNETFYKVAFVSGHQDMILDTTITGYKGTTYITTEDKLFLLSKEEVNKYFAHNYDRYCRGTEYYYAQGGQKDLNDNCSWWLRVYNNTKSGKATVILFDGNIGTWKAKTCRAVRPAMWIDIGDN